ncbi:MAG: homoserine kinase [Sulfurovum sp.]|nr:homoserine kinase [Sulfurovum sp.]
MQITVPATSANLGPGFDTLGLALNLRNEVCIKPSSFLSISTRGEGEESPKIKKNTLFLNVFHRHYRRLGGKDETFRFEFINRIPISRGMGSSSAVIVAAITAAYVVAGAKYNKRSILNLALRHEPHPDNITPCVMGGFNVACVEGSRVFSKKRRLPPHLRAVMVVPDRRISTSRSRHVLPKSYSKEELVYSLSRAAYMTALFMSESWDQLRIAAKDKIHQDRRMRMMPELVEVQKIALENGALMSTLSGSGSSFLSLCYEDDAAGISVALQNRFSHFRVMTFELDNHGVIAKG